MGSEPDPASAPRRPSSRRGKPGRAAGGSAGLAAAPGSMEPPETAGGRADGVPDVRKILHFTFYTSKFT